MVKEIKGANINITSALQQYQSQAQEQYNTSIKDAETMDFEEFEIDSETMSLEEYRNTLDTIKGNYEGELDNINLLLAVLEYKTMDYKEWVLKYKGTYDINELISKASEVSNVDIQNTINQLNQDKALLESTIYKLEQLEKMSEYDYLDQVEEYQNYTGPTGYSEEELNKINYEELFTKVYEGNLESYCKAKGIDINKIDLEAFYEKARTEYSGGYANYCKDTDLANLYELGNEDYIKKYNYYSEKYGEDKASEYLNNMKDAINEGIGAKRAEEYLSTLKVDEDGNYDLNAITNYLSTMFKGGHEGFDSFFEGTMAWFKKEHVYSTSEYEVMYIVQALKENKKLSNILDNVFELSQSMGNMLPGMIIGTAGGMAGLTKLGAITVGTSAGGNSYHSAMASGNDRVDALIYGVLSGASEATLERYLGSLPGIGEVDVTSFKTWIQAIKQEGLEEFVQEYVDGSLRESVLGEDINQWQLFLDALKSFGYGATMGGITNGVKFGVNKKINNNTNTSTIEEIKIKNKTDSNNTINQKNEFEKVSSSLTKNFESITSTNLENKIKELSRNSDKLDQFLFNISKYQLDDLEGFKSLKEFKTKVVDILLDTNVLNDNGTMYILTKDLTMFERIIEKSNVDNLIIKNLGKNVDATKLLVNSYKNLTSKQLNKIFSTDEVKKYISNMPLENFVNVINCFNDDVKWFQCDIFMNKILSFNTEDLYNFISKIKNQSFNLKNLLDTEDFKLYNKLLNKIATTFCQNSTNKNFIKQFEFINDIEKVIAPSYEIEKYENLKKTTKTINESLIKMKQYVYGKLKHNSNIELSNNISIENNLELQNLDKIAIYDLKYEVDGEEKKIKIKTNEYGKKSIYYEFFGDPKYGDGTNNNYLKDILDEKVKILSIDKNEIESKLILNKDSGLVKGFNKIRLLIDGVEEETYVKFKGYSDCELGQKYSNAKSVEILKIEGIGSLDVKIDNSDIDSQNSIYVIEYLLEKKEEQIYLPVISTDLGKNYVLPIDDYIEKYIGSNNLDKISNLKVKKIDENSINRSKLNINNYNSSKDIFSNTKYGGNQSDVSNIFTKYLAGENLTEIEQKKSIDIDNLINNYFKSELNEIEKTNLCKKYSNVGCCYMAFANSICTYMDSLGDGAQIFKNRFGYDLYYYDNEVKNYNTETLALDIFINYHKNILNYDTNNIIENGDGISTQEQLKCIQNFLNKKNINITEYKTPNLFYIKNTKNKLLVQLLNSPKGSFNILSSKHFDLEKISTNNKLDYKNNDIALQNAKKDNNKVSDIGAHAMLITNLNENNDLIVSSWGEKYKFIVESIENYNNTNNEHAWAIINTYKYDIGR